MIAWCESCGARRLLTANGRCDKCGSDSIDCAIHAVSWNAKLENILQKGFEQQCIDEEVDLILRRSQ